MVDQDAQVGAGVTIEPFVTIHGDVIIGDNCIIKSHAVIMNGTRLGRSCSIYQGAIVGGLPQDLKYSGEQTELIIEDHVTIREYCTINKGTAASGETRIKSHALIMAYVHVAHDCNIGHHAIIANSVNLAGHVIIGNYAVVGGMTAVQQFVHIGESAFIGGGGLVRKDVPPYVKAAREPISYVGVNSVGLRRRNFSLHRINGIKDIYRSLFVRHKNISFGLEEIEVTLPESREKDEIVGFIKNSKHGLIRGFRQTKRDDY